MQLLLLMFDVADCGPIFLSAEWTRQVQSTDGVQCG